MDRKPPFPSVVSDPVADLKLAAGRPGLLRLINERVVLEYVRLMGPVSRSEIANGTGMSKPTVAHALRALLASGVIVETRGPRGRPGPAARAYELNHRAGWVAGIAVGRQWVRSAVADLTGTIIARRDERTRLRSMDRLLAQITEVAHLVSGDAGLEWPQVTSVVLGGPGVVEPSHRRFWLAAHNLPGWERLGLTDAVAERLGSRVVFENDANLATMGEQSKGLGKDVANFVFMHIGTGVGMGMVLDGQLYRGNTGAAGEIGYLPVPADLASDPAVLRRGALEATTGASGLVRTARDLGMKAPITPKRVFTAARRGDAVAKQVVEIESEKIALAIASVVAVADPELVVLGGGIGRNGDVLIGPVTANFRRISPFRPRIEVSALGEDAELHGAVALALREARDRLFTR